MGEIGNWFDNLEKIRHRTTNLNGSTARDIYRFSLQQPLALLPGDLQQGNLCQFCQVQGIGYCNANTFKNPMSTFRWFLDDIATPIAEILVFAFYYIARNRLVPPYTGSLVADFRTLKVKDVCSTPVNQAILIQLLFEEVPQAFYAGKGDLMHSAISNEWTIDQMCEEVVK